MWMPVRHPNSSRTQELHALCALADAIVPNGFSSKVGEQAALPVMTWEHERERYSFGFGLPGGVHEGFPEQDDCDPTRAHLWSMSTALSQAMEEVVAQVDEPERTSFPNMPEPVALVTAALPARWVSTSSFRSDQLYYRSGQSSAVFRSEVSAVPAETRHTRHTAYVTEPAPRSSPAPCEPAAPKAGNATSLSRQFMKRFCPPKPKAPAPAEGPAPVVTETRRTAVRDNKADGPADQARPEGPLFAINEATRRKSTRRSTMPERRLDQEGAVVAVAARANAADQVALDPLPRPRPRVCRNMFVTEPAPNSNEEQGSSPQASIASPVCRTFFKALRLSKKEPAVVADEPLRISFGDQKKADCGTDQAPVEEADVVADEPLRISFGEQEKVGCRADQESVEWPAFAGSDKPLRVAFRRSTMPERRLEQASAEPAPQPRFSRRMFTTEPTPCSGEKQESPPQASNACPVTRPFLNSLLSSKKAFAGVAAPTRAPGHVLLERTPHPRVPHRMFVTEPAAKSNSAQAFAGVAAPTRAPGHVLLERTPRPRVPHRMFVTEPAAKSNSAQASDESGDAADEPQRFSFPSYVDRQSFGDEASDANHNVRAEDA